jgi:protoheme IX farnesyltransferase
VSASVVVARRTAPADYLELTKPRITLLVVFTTLVGYAVASPGGMALVPLLPALLGTALVAAGASTLNMLLERRTDSLMLRTRNRPLPSGRLRPPDVLAFGTAVTIAGLVVLRFGSGTAAAAVALLTWATYLFAYTPLKTRTSLSTIVGAFPGALPPVIGWAAARGDVGPGAWVLFSILFLWQIPHFLAIAWIYREDYARGGMPMLPVIDKDGAVTGRQAVANSLALLVVSVVPTAAGLSGYFYLAGAVLLGGLLTASAVRAAVQRTVPAARALFLASVVHLSGICLLLLVDRP